ncbi:MAG: Fe-S protein assembly co-chaperone HscB [Burkholderiales bacterium]|nr:MAG: Fe-S protein assembly co-chaperone HscB [Burkholderiales bacterium]
MTDPRHDHFALFGLPPRFAIDEASLEQAYRRVQSQVHPDRFASAGAAERRVAMQWAARANEAFRTLRSPVARAAYLCERHGQPIEAESNTAMPAEFLMQQMQWREELDEARGGRPEAAQALAREVEERREAVLARVAAALDERHDYADAAAGVRELHFIDRFRDELTAHLAGDLAGAPEH